MLVEARDLDLQCVPVPMLDVSNLDLDGEPLVLPRDVRFVVFTYERCPLFTWARSAVRPARRTINDSRARKASTSIRLSRNTLRSLLLAASCWRAQYAHHSGGGGSSTAARWLRDRVGARQPERNRLGARVLRGLGVRAHHLATATWPLRTRGGRQSSLLASFPVSKSALAAARRRARPSL
jgi:hypothetical protein